MAGQVARRMRLFNTFFRYSLLWKNINRECRCLYHVPSCYNTKYSSSKFKYENRQRSFHTSYNYNKKVSFLLADIGEGIQEVVVREWYVKEGDRVSQFDNVCEVQSDKASVTITSRYDGIIQKIYHEVDGIALVGKPLLDIEVEKEVSAGTVGDEVQEGEAIPLGKPGSVTEGGPIQLPRGDAKILTTPAVRRMAMEHQVDLSKVEGSGKDGRILKEDVLNYIQRKEKGPITPLETSPEKPTVQIESHPKMPPIIPAAPTKPVPVILKQDKTETIKGYRKAMVKTMTESMKTPHFGYNDEIDVTSLMNMKNEFKSILAEHNMRFTFMPFFIKALSMALVHYPVLNSSVDERCEKITLKASHNIGVAMDTAEGLVVPNIKAVQERSILDITEELMRLQRCGQQGNFSRQDLSGGTFTISNIGSIGGTYAKPMILPPEVAIGAIGKIQKVPKFNANNEVIAAQVLKVSWSADHRIIDGATMARFSNRWKLYLEKPAAMCVHMK